MTFSLSTVSTIRPWYMTLIRSDRSKTSWMSWLMRKMPIPSVFSCLTRFPHLRRLGRPERRGRLVHDQDPGVEMDGPGNGHGLALAAGQ